MPCVCETAARLDGLAGTVTSSVTSTAADGRLVPQASVAVACSWLLPGTSVTAPLKRPSPPATRAGPAGWPFSSNCTLAPAAAVPLTTASAARVVLPLTGLPSCGASGAACATVTL